MVWIKVGTARWQGARACAYVSVHVCEYSA